MYFVNKFALLSRENEFGRTTEATKFYRTVDSNHGFIKSLFLNNKHKVFKFMAPIFDGVGL